MPPKTLKDRALFTARARQLEVHREFFASLLVSEPEASDHEIAIGKDVFDAGYNSAAQRAVNFAPTVVRDWAAAREQAWSDYQPPERLCGGGSTNTLGDAI